MNSLFSALRRVDKEQYLQHGVLIPAMGSSGMPLRTKMKSSATLGCERLSNLLKPWVHADPCPFHVLSITILRTLLGRHCNPS
jgi:hypothetical protein